MLDEDPGDDLLAWAWALICNVDQGYWEKQSPEWRTGVHAFRVKYRERLDDVAHFAEAYERRHA